MQVIYCYTLTNTLSIKCQELFPGTAMQDVPFVKERVLDFNEYKVSVLKLEIIKKKKAPHQISTFYLSEHTHDPRTQ